MTSLESRIAALERAKSKRPRRMGPMTREQHMAWLTLDRDSPAGQSLIARGDAWAFDFIQSFMTDLFWKPKID